jgi:hypothetical protein
MLTFPMGLAMLMGSGVGLLILGYAIERANTRSTR